MGKTDSPPVILSEQTRRIQEFVRATDTDAPPTVEQVEALERTDPMAIPDTGVSPDKYSYKWESLFGGALERSIHRKGWVVVTRTNHPDIEDSWFDLATGAVLFGGQNILCFRRKEIADRKAAEIAREFDVSYEKAAAEIEGRYRKSGIRVDEIEKPGSLPPAGRTELLDTTSPDYGPVNG